MNVGRVWDIVIGWEKAGEKDGFPIHRKHEVEDTDLGRLQGEGSLSREGENRNGSQSDKQHEGRQEI